jgi:hypothetical protein
MGCFLHLERVSLLKTNNPSCYTYPRQREFGGLFAAEIAGLTRAEFINALHRFKVSAFQYTADEIVAEVTSR